MSDCDCEDDDVEYDYESEEEDGRDFDVDATEGTSGQDSLPSNRESSVSSWEDTHETPHSPTTPSWNNKYGPGIRITGLGELRLEMLYKMKTVAECLNVPVEAAAVLLHQFAWSSDSLLEQYVDESEKILKKAGVFARCTAVVNSSTKSPSRVTTRSVAKALTCSICYDDDLKTSDMYCMPCKHAFCIACWKGYLHNTLYESGLGPSCVFLTECPHSGCQEKVTEAEFSDLLSIKHKAMNSSYERSDGELVHPDLKQFRYFLLRAYVEANPLTQVCPAPGCDRVASASSRMVLEQQQGIVVCDNVALHSETSSMPFCFCAYCGHDEAHAPVTCKLLQMWLTMCQNESANVNWMLANTKPCPKCSTRIEKNQGKVIWLL
jgi:ariadne-1